jgi:hypothetical protein
MGIKDTVDQISRAAGMTPPVDREQVTLTDGSKVTPDHRELKPNGQQKGYVVLSDAERARGFVRPVRRSYVHVGRPAPKYPLRDITDDDLRECGLTRGEYGYVKYEEYPPGQDGCGRFWKQPDLDKIGKGCGCVTTMGVSIAETYARDPKFYGATFCCGCGTHLPVGQDGEFVWDGTSERVGT